MYNDLVSENEPLQAMQDNDLTYVRRRSKWCKLIHKFFAVMNDLYEICKKSNFKLKNLLCYLNASPTDEAEQTQTPYVTLILYYQGLFIWLGFLIHAFPFNLRYGPKCKETVGIGSLKERNPKSMPFDRFFGDNN